MPPQDTTPTGKVCGVYVIENTVNGRVYIGSSVDVMTRWTEHRWRLNRKQHTNAHLQLAWHAYGAAAFEFRLLVETLPESCRRVEAATMRLYLPTELYNHMTPDEQSGVLAHSDEARRKVGTANRGHVHSAEVRQRIREAVLARPPRSEATCEKLRLANLGQKHGPPTDAQRRRMSEAQRGKTISLEQRQKMSVRLKGRALSAAHRQALSEGQRRRFTSAEERQKIAVGHRGKALSAEHRAKIGAAHRGRVVSEESRERMRVAHQGKVGRPQSAETRAKISVTMQAYRRQQRETEGT